MSHNSCQKQVRKMKSSIEKVIQEITDSWMNINGVNGIGQSRIDEEDCILVTVDIKTSEIEKNIPAEYKGFVVKLLVTGPIIAEESKQLRKKKGSCAL